VVALGAALGALLRLNLSDRQRLSRKDQRCRTAEHDQPPREVERVDSASGSDKRMGKGKCAVHNRSNRAKNLTNR